jgi:hypothetical protein
MSATRANQTAVHPVTNFSSQQLDSSEYFKECRMAAFYEQATWLMSEWIKETKQQPSRLSAIESHHEIEGGAPGDLTRKVKIRG